MPLCALYPPPPSHWTKDVPRSVLGPCQVLLLFWGGLQPRGSSFREIPSTLAPPLPTLLTPIFVKWH